MKIQIMREVKAVPIVAILLIALTILTIIAASLFVTAVIIIPVILFVGSCFIAILYRHFLNNCTMLMKEGVHAQATVTERLTISPKLKSNDSCTQITYQFMDRKGHQVVKTVRSPNLLGEVQVGNIIAIRYLLRKPAINLPEVFLQNLPALSKTP